MAGSRTEQLVGCEEAQPGRGELDRERKAIEVAAELVEELRPAALVGAG